MSFSERYGHKNKSLELQVSSMDSPLRNGLWNAIQMSYFDDLPDFWEAEPATKALFFRIQANYFKLTVDSIDNFCPTYISFLRKEFFSFEWNEVYDFAEFMINVQKTNEDWDEISGRLKRRVQYIKFVNIILEKEISAYRVVDDKIVKLTEDIEISEVNESARFKGKFEPVAQHIKAAISLFSDREKPDYRNTIKESISAVEAAAKIISEDPKATLSDALKIIDEKHKLHAALREGLKKIYGYTSDQGGIRHSLMETDNINSADAKFMLVNCSAFCNFLIEQYGVSK